LNLIVYVKLIISLPCVVYDGLACSKIHVCDWSV